MTAPTTAARPAPHSRVPPALLLAGFAVALWLRMSVGGIDVARSPTAGLVFAVALTVLSVVVGVRVRWSPRALAVGVAGGLVLCLPVVLVQGGTVGEHRPAGSYASWALVVAAVAVAEEVFLRGALFDAVRARRGDVAAVLIAAVAFAVLHVPLYGIGAVPLDLAVGVWFGGLRLVAGSVLAPAAAHVTADVVAWWLR